MNRVLRFNFCQNQLILGSSIYIEVACSLLDSEPGFSVLLLISKLNFMRQVMNEQGCILKTFIRTSVFFAGRFTLNRSSPPVRNATHLRTFCFLRSYFCLWRDFCQPACTFAAPLTLKTALNSHKAKLATNLRTFCFKDHHYESFCLRGTLCPVPLAHQIFVFY